MILAILSSSVQYSLLIRGDIIPAPPADETVDSTERIYYSRTSVLKLKSFWKLFENWFVWKLHLFCLLPKRHVTDYTGMSVKELSDGELKFCFTTETFFLWRTRETFQDGRCSRAKVYMFCVFFLNIFTFSLQGGPLWLYFAYMNCQHHCLYALGPLLNKIGVTWTQTLCMILQ